MRAVVQRVRRGSVRVDDEIVGNIGAGLALFVGVGEGDTVATAGRLAARVTGLRIFADDRGRMNRNLLQHGGSALVISQFTLYADASRGHRPSFLGAARPELAVPLCDAFAGSLRAAGVSVAEGRFGAHMEVELVNDGPVTIVLSSGEPDWPSDAG
ncbi:MAG: D-aminoacyl-tRNA deacylase [Candidatus Dormibacteria bacterium]